MSTYTQRANRGNKQIYKGENQRIQTIVNKDKRPTINKRKQIQTKASNNEQKESKERHKETNNKTILKRCELQHIRISNNLRKQADAKGEHEEYTNTNNIKQMQAISNKNINMQTKTNRNTQKQNNTHKQVKTTSNQRKQANVNENQTKANEQISKQDQAKRNRNKQTLIS